MTTATSMPSCRRRDRAAVGDATGARAAKLRNIAATLIRRAACDRAVVADAAGEDEDEGREYWH